MRQTGICSILVLSTLLHSTHLCAANKPTILYTDIVAGPNSGGENNKGAYLSIFGVNFGSRINDIKVYVGGGEVARYMYLGPSRGRPDIQQLSVQLGSAVKTGAIKVSVNGVDSHTDHTFTVAAGDIYFMSITGNDTTGDGSFTNPYRTASKIMGLPAFGAGDFLVIRGGTYDLSSGNEGLTGFGLRWLDFGNKGGSSPTQHLVVMGYPGEEPVIDWGTITTNDHTAIYILGAYKASYITICGFKIDAQGSGAIVTIFGTYGKPNTGLAYGRFINMQIEGGMAGTYAANYPREYQGVNIMSVSRVPYSKFLGNGIGNHNGLTGCRSHSFYMSHEYTGVEFAYNYLHDNIGGRAFLQMAGDEWGRQDVTTDAYSWTKSTHGTDEYYVRLAGLSDPGIPFLPDAVVFPDSYFKLRMNVGSLAPDTWGYGDNDGLGFNTVYVRHSDGHDPDELVGSPPGAKIRISVYDSDTWGDNSNVHVHDNIFKNLPQEAIITGNGATGPFYIYNNVFDNLHQNGIGGWYSLSFRSLGTMQDASVFLYNNTLNDNTPTGLTGGLLHFGWTSGTKPALLVMKNNIFNARNSNSRYVLSGNPNLTIVSDYNLWYGSRDTVPSWEGAHSINADPQFVNASGGDLSLKATSPAIRKGTNQIEVAIRKDIQVKLRRMSPSIGAHEYDDGSESPKDIQTLNKK